MRYAPFCSDVYGLHFASKPSILEIEHKVKHKFSSDAPYRSLSSEKGVAHHQTRFAMKQRQRRRSDCPINFALETFGDMWSLLIVRDIIYFGKKTYSEFLESDEGIATNILASRLAQLEQKGVLLKKPHTTDKRKEVYVLTEKGLDLLPILLEMASWSAQHDPHTAAPHAWIAMVNADKAKVIRRIRETVQSGGSIFVGSNSVVSQLGETETE
jgi:DNA-binding HxlR family transcriptional regulator